MTKIDNKTFARLVVSAETLLNENGFACVIAGVIEALENQKTYLRRDGDNLAKEAINTRINKLRGIL